MGFLKNCTTYRYSVIGILFGLMVLVLGLWLEFIRYQLSFELSAFAYIHRIDPFFIVLELAPLLFGIERRLIGAQRGIVQSDRTEQERMGI